MGCGNLCGAHQRVLLIACGDAPSDIHPDGQRFLVNTPLEITNSVPATVVLNWTREFQKK